nr:immunoglobulin light chain junction region [Macaca mulatta]
CQQHNGYPPMF